MPEYVIQRKSDGKFYTGFGWSNDYLTAKGYEYLEIVDNIKNFENWPGTPAYIIRDYGTGKERKYVL